jgi:hypothetical protein
VSIPEEQDHDIFEFKIQIQIWNLESPIRVRLALLFSRGDLGYDPRSAWKPTDVVSISDVVQLLWERRDVLGLSLEVSVEELGLSDGACHTCSAYTKVCREE